MLGDTKTAGLDVLPVGAADAREAVDVGVGDVCTDAAFAAFNASFVATRPATVLPVLLEIWEDWFDI